MTVGLDTNILCYSLDPAYPEHKFLRKLLLDLSPENTIAINPTVLHETYHTLVFYLQWLPQEAAERLSLLLKHPYIKFYNQTKQISQIALNIGTQNNLGGRDALIIANFVANKIPTVLTHDQDLIAISKIAWKNFYLTFKDPLKTN
jgi:predicted nucleic acid-binding protein